MPPKRRGGARVPGRVTIMPLMMPSAMAGSGMRGKGWLRSLGNAIGKAAGWVGNTVKDVAKETKILSTLSNKLPVVGSALSGAIASKGYGRKKRGGARVRKVY